MIENSEVEQPIDLVKNSIGKRVYVKLKNDRDLTGKLHVLKSLK